MNVDTVEISSTIVPPPLPIQLAENVKLRELAALEKIKSQIPRLCEPKEILINGGRTLKLLYIRAYTRPGYVAWSLDYYAGINKKEALDVCHSTFRRPSTKAIGIRAIFICGIASRYSIPFFVRHVYEALQQQVSLRVSLKEKREREKKRVHRPV